MVIRYNKPPSQRQLQVAEEIRHALCEIFIRNELSHPFFEKYVLTISQVRISPDLKLATAFVVIPLDLDEKQLLKMLNDISSSIKKLLSKKVKLRVMPTIRFAGDSAFNSGYEVDAILKNLK